MRENANVFFLFVTSKKKGEIAECRHRVLFVIEKRGKDESQLFASRMNRVENLSKKIFQFFAVECRAFDALPNGRGRGLFVIGVDSFEIDLPVDLFDFLHARRIVDAVVLSKDLSTRIVDRQAFHRLNDQPGTFPFLDVRADLARPSDVAVAIEIIVLDLKVIADVQENRFQLRIVDERRQRTDRQAEKDRKENGVIRRLPGDDSEVMFFGEEVNGREFTRGLQIETLTDDRPLKDLVKEMIDFHLIGKMSTQESERRRIQIEGIIDG